MKLLSAAAKATLLGVVGFYQKAISPLTPATCRFQPTCSEYARRALETHGPLKGSWLALRRLLRCHPFGGHGFDPVPARTSATTPSAPGAPPASAQGSSKEAV